MSVLPSHLLIARKDFRGPGKPPAAHQDFLLGAHDPWPQADVIQHFFSTPQANGKAAEARAAHRKLGHAGKEEKRTPGWLKRHPAGLPTAAAEGPNYVGNT